MGWSVKSSEHEQVRDEDPNLYMRRAENELRYNNNIMGAISEIDKAYNFDKGNKMFYFWQKIKILKSVGDKEQCKKIIEDNADEFREAITTDKVIQILDFYKWSIDNKYNEFIKLSILKELPVIATNMLFNDIVLSEENVYAAAKRSSLENEYEDVVEICLWAQHQYKVFKSKYKEMLVDTYIYIGKMNEALLVLRELASSDEIKGEYIREKINIEKKLSLYDDVIDDFCYLIQKKFDTTCCEELGNLYIDLGKCDSGIFQIRNLINHLRENIGVTRNLYLLLLRLYDETENYKKSLYCIRVLKMEFKATVPPNTERDLYIKKRQIQTGIMIVVILIVMTAVAIIFGL